MNGVSNAQYSESTAYDVKRKPRLLTPGRVYVLASILIVLAIMLAGALYLGSSVLRVDEALTSDPAADMLLEREIDDKGYLLTGHYSIFEFNHPGPFFLYAYHLTHSILDGHGRPISVVAYLTTVLLNVGFLLTGGILAHRALGAKIHLYSLLGAILISFSVIGNDIYGLWMPYKITLPLFAYFFSLILLVQRRLQYWPVACLLASILIHGYVTMVVLALPLLFVALAWGFYCHGDNVDRSEKLYLIAGLLVGGLFAAPLAVDFIINDPSNLEKILIASRQKFEHPTWTEIVGSLSMLAMRQITIIQLAILILGSYVVHSHDLLRKRWRSCLQMALLLVVIFVIYHKFGPPLFENGWPHVNMLLFMQAVPMALICASLVVLFHVVDEFARKQGRQWHVASAGLILVAILCVSAIRPLSIQPAASHYIRELASYVEDVAKKSDRAVINYTHKDQWVVMTGVLFELKRNHINACTTWQHLKTLYTPKMVCEEGAVANILLMPESECNGRCTIVMGGTGVMVPPPPG